MEKVDKTETSTAQVDAYRKVLSTSVVHLLKENGFQSADKIAVETLTEMLQSILCELGRSTRGLSELAGRVFTVPGDAIVAVVNMGLKLDGIESYAKRPGRPTVALPPTAVPQKQPTLLPAGTKPNHPPHIPSHLPPLPDAHAYVRTPTHKQPVTEYEAIREKAANQKRDMEKSLVRFLCKTLPTESLFEPDSENLFPLIAPQPEFPTYASALNPSDQIFDFEELEYHYQVANRTEDITTKVDDDSANEDEEMPESKPTADNDIKPNSSTNRAILENPNIDNPYLRAASLPKRSKTVAA